MTTSEIIEVTGIFLGSSAVLKLIELFFTRRINKVKVTEAENESEFKISDHYKKELKDLLTSHRELTRRFNELKHEYDNVIEQVGVIQKDYDALQSQIDILKKSIK